MNRIGDIALLITTKILQSYFRGLDAAFLSILKFTGVITDERFNTLIGSSSSIDERIAKLDVARANLSEGLLAIDQLKADAQKNRQQVEEALIELERLENERQLKAGEIAEVKKIASSDTATLRSILGIPSPGKVWRERLYGFFSGVSASLLAAAMWQMLIQK